MMERYSQPGRAPTRKVAFGTAGAVIGGPSAAMALIWVAGLLGGEIPMPVAIWLCAAIGAFLGGYLPTERMQGT